MTQWLDSLSPVWLHLATFGLMFLEGMGVPGVPGVLPMLALAESIHAAQTTLLQAILWGVAGNWLGSLLGYQLARLVLRRLPPGWQRAAHSRRTARLVGRWGALLVLVSRTVGSLRTPVTLYAGASGFSWPLYLRASLLGALLHVGLWQTLLWRFGPDILHSSPQLWARAWPYLGALAALGLLWLLLRRRGVGGGGRGGEDGQVGEQS